MAIGFAARYSASIALFAGTDDSVAAVRTALEQLRWPYKVLWGNEFHAFPPHGGWSWGEEVIVRVESAGCVQVESKCVRFGQWFDLGANKRNVAAFRARIQKINQTSSF